MIISSEEVVKFIERKYGLSGVKVELICNDEKGLLVFIEDFCNGIVITAEMFGCQSVYYGKKIIKLSEVADVLEDHYGKKIPIITHISNVFGHSCIIVYIAEADGVGYMVHPSMFGYDYDDCMFYDDETNQVMIK